MKRCRLLITVFLMAIVMMGSSGVGHAAVPNYIPWSNHVSIPDANDIYAYQGTQRAPYICCEPTFNGVKTYDEFSVDFRCDYAPPGTYLCVNTWDFDDYGLRSRYASVKRDYSGVAGYAGFQKFDDGSTWVIMTVWDAYCYDQQGNLTLVEARQIYPENNRGFESCRDDLVTGEGFFVHTILPYDWQEGRNYRALMQLSNPNDGGNSHLIFWACDLQTGVWTRLIEYDLGYNGNCMNRCVAFLEDFSRGGAGNIRSMALSNYRARVTGSTNWVSAREATLSCYYSNNGSYQYGADGNAFWAITTGLPNRWSTPRDNARYTVTDAESGCPY